VLDSKGLPWDHRIHAGSKSKIGDGSWRAKKGVAPEVATAVEAELRQALNASVPLPAAVTPPPATLPLAPPPPVSTPPAPPVAGVGFVDFLLRVSPHFNDARISQLQVATILGRYGLTNLTQLANSKPEVLAAVVNDFAPLIAAAEATA
jgi:hypothetical protein